MCRYHGRPLRAVGARPTPARTRTSTWPLAAYLVQRGSSESKPIEGDAPQDADARLADKRAQVPWPMRRGGWVLTLYEHSLSSLFFLLFLASIALHATGGARADRPEQRAPGEPAVSVWTYVRTSVLVRVLSELAIGVPGRCGDRRCLGVPA